MPKKTRKEKIISQLRRQLQNNQQPAQNSSVEEKRKSFAYSIKNTLLEQNMLNTPRESIRSLKENIYTLDHSYVLSDLKRIFGFTFIALVVEFILFFLINRFKFGL